MGVLTGVGGPIEVFLPPTSPPVAGLAGTVAVGDAARLGLPGPEIIAVVVAFDLMRRGGSPPKEPDGEGVCGADQPGVPPTPLRSTACTSIDRSPLRRNPTSKASACPAPSSSSIR